MKRRIQRGFILIVCVIAMMPIAAIGNTPGKTKYNKNKTQRSTPEPDGTPNKAKQHQLVSSISEANLPHTIDNYSRDGIDVSHYQGNINWEIVARETGISYAYLKATEGASLVDDTYRRNLKGAKRAGIKVGSYHFYRPNVSVEEQIQNITTNILPEEQDLLPIIDVEHAGKVSEEQFVSDLRRFIEQVTKFYGRRPLIYTFHNFYNRHLSGKFPGYKWMIARYREDEPTLDDGQDFIVWQYTAKGSIPGIRGNVDKSKIMENYSLSEILF